MTMSDPESPRVIMSDCVSESDHGCIIMSD